MAMKKVFKSVQPSIQYVFKNGKVAAFINYEYMTDLENEIEELNAEIGAVGFGKSKQPHIYIDADKTEIDTDALDPIAVIKQQAIKEYLAAQAEAMKTSNDRGNTGPANARAGMVTTQTVAEMSAGSDSGAGTVTETKPAAGVGIKVNTGK